MRKLGLHGFLKPLLMPLILLAASFNASAQQSLDFGGAPLLNGNYFFRWVIFSNISSSGNFGQGTAVSGTISFDGRGGYRINGKLTDSTRLNQVTVWSRTGTYTVSASGLAEIQNPIFPEDTLRAGVGTAGIIGSTTEGSNQSLFLAIPALANGLGNDKVVGTYQVGVQDFPGATGGPSNRFAYFALPADGAGNFGTFQPQGCATDLKTCAPPAIAGATYRVSSDGSGTFNFPSSAGTAIVGGSKTMYFSADASMFIGGSDNGFDIIIGLRPVDPKTQSPPSGYQGLFYSGFLSKGVNCTCAASGFGAISVYGTSTASTFRNYMRQNEPGNVHYDFTSTATDSAAFGPDGVGRTTRSGRYRVIGPGSLVDFDISGPTSEDNSLTVRFRQPSLASAGVFINPQGIVNAASLTPLPNPIAPGEYISLFGSGFTATTAVAENYPFPTTLKDVQVRINGRPAPLYFVSPGQINLLVPYAITEPYASIQVISGGQLSNTVSTYVRASAPAVFTSPAGGDGTPAVLHADYTFVTKAAPIRPGETLTVFATGLGAVTPPVADGVAAPVSPLALFPANKLHVVLDSLELKTVFAGLAPGYAGLYQINLTVPSKIDSIVPKGIPGPWAMTLELDTAEAEVDVPVYVAPN